MKEVGDMNLLQMVQNTGIRIGKEEADFHFNGRKFFYIIAVDEINDSLLEYPIDKIVNDENYARKLILK